MGQADAHPGERAFRQAQELADFSLSPGRIEFDSRIGRKSHRLWIRGVAGDAGEMTPHADSALALGLMPAMREGGVLRVEGDVSPKILRMQREFQAIQRVWSHHWPFEARPLREVEVVAGQREVPAPRRGRVAIFFSGGVDSWASVLTEPEVTDLIFVKGVDILPSLSPRHVGLGERVEPLLREMAEDLGKPLHVVETNIREFSEQFLGWGVYNNSALSAVALCFESLFERVLITTETDYATQVPHGPSSLIDSLWSSEALEILDHGSRHGRFERTRLIADDPRVQRSLRVCYMNYDGAYNCGRCRKCLLTMLSLEALGVRQAFTTFPPELDLSPLDESEVEIQVQYVLWDDCLRGIEECGREDLARQIRPVVERASRRFADPALVAAREEAAAAEAQLREILGSTSWRITRPLRRAGRAARRLRG